MLVLLISLPGCMQSKEEKAPEDQQCVDLEFEITDENDVSQKIKEKMYQKQEKPYFFTYKDGKDMYIVIGYGPKPTGGYSVKVNSVQQCGEEIVIKTELVSPSKEDVVTTAISYPAIILKLGKIDGKCKVYAK